MIPIVINMLLEDPDAKDQSSRFLRILDVDAATANVPFIYMESDRLVPEWTTVPELNARLEEGSLLALSVDPYLPPAVKEEEIEPKRRRKRDHQWALISSLVLDSTKQVLDPHWRNRVIAKVAAEHKVRRWKIYRCLARYWRRGQTKNALLPDTDRCGNRNQRKAGASRKRGRPSELSKRDPEKHGVNLGEHERKLFDVGLKRFYQTRLAPSLRQAYELTLQTYFKIGYTWDGGVRVPVLPPAHALPSWFQFRDHYNRIFRKPNQESVLRARVGNNAFQRNHRPLLGTWKDKVFGPGAVYQMDSTIGDIYLVSSINRAEVIGRPIIYLIVDVFSWLIVGYYVGIEGGAGWPAAQLALRNAFSDKVSWCKRFDIAIDAAEWPSVHLPDAIYWDRGPEFTSHHAEQLAEAFNVKLTNTPPYAAELRPHVERGFHFLNDDLLRWLPGHVSKEWTRGDPVPAKEAALDLHALEELVIWFCLHHNARRLPQALEREGLLQADIDATPVSLWRWGVENRSGLLRTADPNLVRANLLPNADVSVSEKGIRLHQLTYVCPAAIKEHWMVRNTRSKAWTANAGYDLRDVSRIWLRVDKGRDIKECTLHPESQHFAGYTLEELEAHWKQRRAEEANAQTQVQQNAARFVAHRDAVIKTATRKTRAARKKQDITTANIRNNRAHERSVLARGGTVQPSVKATLPHPQVPNEEVYIGEPDRTEWLRSKLHARLEAQ